MVQSIIAEAAKEESWRAFYQYKKEKQHLSAKECMELENFIEKKAYEPLCKAWEKGTFPEGFPQKHIINKEGVRKKRMVYSFSGEEGIFLKFVASRLYRYDELFCKNCYAFRKEYGVKQAVSFLKSKNLEKQYCLKIDISNYFNSMDVSLLVEKLQFLEKSDKKLYELLTGILLEPRVWNQDKLEEDEHGAMAGTPISAFFANLYLADVDWFFWKEGVYYLRYSDDILLFAENEQELEFRKEQLYRKIKEHKLSVNQDKVSVSGPGEIWEFLGFSYHEGQIDLSKNTIRKTKAKIKRKAEALRRWQREKGLSEEKAAVGLIHVMNRKFFGDDCEDEFTWSRWFFPNLSRADGLKEIDAYLQEYIRYAVTGRHYKGNYKITYQMLKKWGYRNLVHEYYSYRDAACF